MSFKKVVLIVVLSGFFLYLATLRGFSSGFDSLSSLSTYYVMGYGTAFESPHERSTYLMMLNMVEHHQIQLSPGNASWGGIDIGTYRGKIFSFFPPGVAVVAIPFFLVGKAIGLAQVFSYLPVIIAASLCIGLLCLITKEFFKVSTAAAVFAGLLFAFGTPSWSYAVTFYQHLFTTCLMLGSLYCAYRFEKTQRYLWLLGSLFVYALSWPFDYTNIVLLFPIIVYLGSVAYSHKKTLVKNLSTIIIALILVASSIMIYNATVFGKWYATSNNLVRYNPANQVGSVERTQRENITSTFSLRYIPSGFYTLLVSPYRGLLFFSPIFLVVLSSLVMLRKKWTKATITLIALFCSTLLLYSLFKYPYGGWAFGPRVMIPAMAALSPFVAFWLEKSLWKSKAVIALVLTLYGTLLALFGALTTSMIPYITHAAENNGDYTFSRLFFYLFNDHTPSVIYNNLFSGIPLLAYYLILLLPLVGTLSLLIFRISDKNKRHQHKAQ